MRRLVALLSLVLIAASPLASEDGNAAAPYRVGAARADITWHVGQERLGPGWTVVEEDPHLHAAVGHRHAHDSAPTDPLLYPGVHSRLYAKTIAVDGPQPGTDDAVVMVSADLLMVTGSLYESAAQLVEQRSGIPPERLLVSATHTHGASNGFHPHPVHSAFSRSMDPRERQFIAEGIARSVADALSSLRPAALAVGSGYVSLPTMNRRHISNDATPGSCRPVDDPDCGRIDPELGVLRFDDAATGEPIAVLLNYAIHPVMLHPGDWNPVTLGVASPDWMNRLITADLVTYAEHGVERALARQGGAPVAMWFTGAAGDQEPVLSPWTGSRYSDAEWVGTLFAEEAARVARELEPAPLLGVDVAERVVAFPDVDPERTVPEGRTPLVGGAALVPSSARLQVIELETENNRTALLSWPGEPIRDLGVELKAGARPLGFDQAFVVGLANDWAGYWLTPEEYDRGGYERTFAFYGRTAADDVQRHLLELAGALAADATPPAYTLPPHAAADRASVAAAATAVRLSQDVAGEPRVVTPDGDPTSLAQPGPTPRGSAVRYVWRGGSPEVSQGWIPQVQIQRCVGSCRAGARAAARSSKWMTVAREGAGELLVWEMTASPARVDTSGPEGAEHRWTAHWQPLLDAPAGTYRFVVSGHRQAEVGRISTYELTSRTFTVEPCRCIHPRPGPREESGENVLVQPTWEEALQVRPLGDGTVELSLRARYQDVPQGTRLGTGFRKLPSIVTTGAVTVHVVRDGELIDVIELPFVSSPGTTRTRLGGVWVDLPDEHGAFEGVWDGPGDVSFVVHDVRDAHGNTW